MQPTVISPKRKPVWIVRATIVLLALAPAFALFASEGSAANPQPQSPQSSASPDAPESPKATCPAGGQCFADVAAGNPFYDFVNRIYVQDLVTGYACGGPNEPCDAQSRPYYRPGAIVTRQQMAKFIDNARRLPSIELVGASSNPLIYAGNSSSGVAIWGNGTSGSGVYGGSNSSSGVFGGSYTNYGVYGSSTFGTGVYGFTGAANGNWAGYFAGNVNVTGNCCNAGAGTYKIDDPLDPANKYLYHSAVQSPDMKNIYDGIVVLDGEGRAWVQLPDWFEALNIDYRYQLTPIGASGRDLRIAREIENNRFEIAGGQPGMKVSWQVTAIRQDAYANAHRTPVEEDKPADEKGKYLHPTEWGQPASLGVDYEEQQRMLQPMQP